VEEWDIEIRGVRKERGAHECKSRTKKEKKKQELTSSHSP
jgi:hypothetical protein